MDYETSIFMLVVVAGISYAIFLAMKKEHKAYSLLCTVSEDVNEIKKKLGLPVPPRTDKQEDSYTRQNIMFKAFLGSFDGKNRDEIKKEMKDAFKSKKWIEKYLPVAELCVEHRNKLMYCKKCDKVCFVAESKALRCPVCDALALMTPDETRKYFDEQRR